MSEIISYQKNIPFVKRFFGFAFAGLGLVLFLSTLSIIAMLIIIIGLGLNVTEGSEINLSQKSFRTFKSLFGFKYGSWKSVPNFEYVSVFKRKESQTVRVVTAETTQTYSIIHLNLFYDRNKNITFYKTTDKAEALKVAEHFRLALGIAVLDATEKEKKWL